MIKNISISAINAFYYLIFSIVFLVFTYEPTFNFYFFSSFLLIASLYTVIQWFVCLHQHVLIRAYFLKKDIFYRLTPLLLLLLAFPFKDNDYISYTTPYLAFIIFVIPVFFKTFELYFTFPMKILKFIMNQLAVNTIFSFDNNIRFNWTDINEVVKSTTNLSYYIVDNCYFNNEYITIYSSGKEVEFNYGAKHFLLDGIIVSADVIHKMQDEYQLNLFDMNDEQLELIKMIAI